MCQATDAWHFVSPPGSVRWSLPHGYEFELLTFVFSSDWILSCLVPRSSDGVWEPSHHYEHHHIIIVIIIIIIIIMSLLLCVCGDKSRIHTPTLIDHRTWGVCFKYSGVLLYPYYQCWHYWLLIKIEIVLMTIRALTKQHDSLSVFLFFVEQNSLCIGTPCLYFCTLLIDSNIYYLPASLEGVSIKQKKCYTRMYSLTFVVTFIFRFLWIAWVI